MVHGRKSKKLYSFWASASRSFILNTLLTIWNLSIVLLISILQQETAIWKDVVNSCTFARLQRKVDKRHKGETPFHCAASRGQLDVVRFICHSWSRCRSSIGRDVAGHVMTFLSPVDEVIVYKLSSTWRHWGTRHSSQVKYCSLSWV